MFLSPLSKSEPVEREGSVRSFKFETDQWEWTDQKDSGACRKQVWRYYPHPESEQNSIPDDDKCINGVESKRQNKFHMNRIWSNANILFSIARKMARIFRLSLSIA